MGSVLLLIDNSNIYVSTVQYFDKDARLSYDRFENVCRGNDVIIEKHLAGSTPPANDAFWSRMERIGYKVHTYERVPDGYGHKKEKGVDMAIGVWGGAAIQRLKPERVVLLTGDRDFIPFTGLRDEMRQLQGHSFELDVWSFSDSLSSKLEKACDHVYKIEDYKERLIYFQYEDGTIELFTEREKRIEAERIALLEAQNAAQEKREAEKAAQDLIRAKEKATEEKRKAAAAETRRKIWAKIRQGGLVATGLAIAGIALNAVLRRDK